MLTAVGVGFNANDRDRRGKPSSCPGPVEGHVVANTRRDAALAMRPWSPP